MAWRVERRFFRKISVPNEQVLREGDVAPEEHKGKHELAEVMIVFRCHSLAQDAVAFEVTIPQDAESIDAEVTAGEDINTEDGAVPGGRQ